MITTTARRTVRLIPPVSAPQVAADETADSHGHAVSPVDLAVDHEHDQCHAPQAPREQVLQGNDALDVTHPQQTKDTDHQNADAGSEVPTVDGHNEHDSHRKRPQRRLQAAVFLGAPPRESRGSSTNRTVPPNTSHGTRPWKFRSPVQTSNSAPTSPPSALVTRNNRSHSRGTSPSLLRVVGDAL